MVRDLGGGSRAGGEKRWLVFQTTSEGEGREVQDAWQRALKKWRDLSPQLFKHYAHCMHVCDASGEMRAVVEQLAPCFLIKA